MAELIAKEPVVSNVPCNGCTACCHDDVIFLHPDFGDDPSQYQTRELTIRGETHIVLAKDPTGKHCVYLGRNGCTIHDRAPAVCREFDCAGLVKKAGSAEVRRLVKRGLMDKAVAQRGKELLRRGYRPGKQWRR